jgi:hypothetical protein
MTRQNAARLSFLLLAGFVLLTLGSCKSITLTDNSVSTPTTVAQFIVFDPPKDLNVHVKFNYPSSWIFSMEKQNSFGFINIGLGDPRFRSLPTPDLDNETRTINDFGNIEIWIQPTRPGQTADSELQSLLKGYTAERMINILNDSKIMIDGFDAGVLEYEINDSGTYSSLMFARRTFFVVGDQLYVIYFTIAEKDRGNEFEKGYEHFFNSLKIVP